MDSNVGVEYSFLDFGDALRELKAKRGFSYKQIAQKTGLSDAYLIKLVKKDLLPPKDENIRKIARALRVDPTYFKEYRVRRIQEQLMVDHELEMEVFQKIKERLQDQEARAAGLRPEDDEIKYYLEQAKSLAAALGEGFYVRENIEKMGYNDKRELALLVKELLERVRKMTSKS